MNGNCCPGRGGEWELLSRTGGTGVNGLGSLGIFGKARGDWVTAVNYLQPLVNVGVSGLELVQPLKEPSCH